MLANGYRMANHNWRSLTGRASLRHKVTPRLWRQQVEHMMATRTKVAQAVFDAVLKMGEGLPWSACRSGSQSHPEAAAFKRCGGEVLGKRHHEDGRWVLRR
jgi:hypothetical protein